MVCWIPLHVWPAPTGLGVERSDGGPRMKTTMSRNDRRLVRHVKRQLLRARDRLKYWCLHSAHTRDVFTRIHRTNLWGGRDSVSGCGSGYEETANLRLALPELLNSLEINDVLDAPCGDFFWMKHVVPHIPNYAGVDIVEDLITENQKLYGRENVRFLCADIAEDPLPPCDLVICRDFFIHLPTFMIRKCLTNYARTGAKYILLTNDACAPPYRDIPTGAWRKINFRAPPFSWPEPRFTIDEHESSERQMCLWAFDDLPKEAFV